MTEHRVSVLGGGSFGTAVANMIATNGVPTHLWMRDVERAQRCTETRENDDYLPGYTLHPNLTITADFSEAIAKSNIIFISVPSDSFRSIAKEAAPYLRDDTIVISTTKGIELNSFCLMSQILEQELPGRPIGVLSGPNFAKEIIQGQLTGTVIASESDQVTELIPQLLSSKTFRVYTNRDRYGVELGGALKNIYAIMAGMAAAIGVGYNTTAMLMTRALAEMGRFAAKWGADPMTFLGLSGVGDLILTCSSDLSRNYRLGFGVGQGRPLDEVQKEIGQAVEGVNTVQLVQAKAAELDVYMPLVNGLYAVMFEGKPLAQVMGQLMLGEQAFDVEFARKT